MASLKKKHTIQCDNWGYAFIAPFFIIYVVFSLIPLVTTFTYSLFEYYRVGLQEIGPNFVKFDNFVKIFNANDSLAKYFLNTLIMWAMGFIPQIIISLLLAVSLMADSIDGVTVSAYIITLPLLFLAALPIV